MTPGASGPQGLGRFFMKILVDRAVLDSPLTRRVLTALPQTPTEVVDHDPGPFFAGDASRSKKILYLTRFRGQSIKPCPGTRDYICCGYQIFHTAVNCPLDCRYCILQAYFNQPFLRLFANLEDIFRDLHQFLRRQKGKIVRLGTGEFADSLALDPLTGFSSLLLEEILPYPGVVVELKTKSAAVANLLSLDHTEKFIVSWSLNPASLVKSEERRAASLRRRLESARSCQERGYRLGFHFDPIFILPGWEKSYRRTIQMLFDYADPGRIAWISLGCFRYLPALKAIIRERSPRSQILQGEFIPALDRKMRYLQPLRVDVYGKMKEWLRRYGGDILVYLCMENAAVWQKVFGFIPGQGHPSLAEMLDRRV
jgi:spore photoproduct lyase